MQKSLIVPPLLSSTKTAAAPACAFAGGNARRNNWASVRETGCKCLVTVETSVKHQFAEMRNAAYPR